jgi:hypothetical protein
MEVLTLLVRNLTSLNFISVLATQDNTTVNFSEFGNGVTILNNTPTNDVLLNSGESYHHRYKAI